MTLFIFWFSIFYICYVYLGYPFILWSISKVKTIDHFITSDDWYRPYTTIIISMANESKDKIRQKISNTRYLMYTPLEVIIALDNPSTETKDFITEIIPPSWKMVSSDTSLGKEELQKMAVAASSDQSDIFVFTDVSSNLNSDAVLKLTQHFIDPLIGAVDGESKIVSENGLSSEGLYLRYENKIRDLESKVGSLVTTGGCLFAIRKEIADELFSLPIQSDFGSALVSTSKGFRSVIETEAVATFQDLKNPSQEFSRKRRTVLRGMNTLWIMKSLLNPFRYGFFSFQLWSHKVMKWKVPFALIAVLISNLFLFTPFYGLVLLGQFIFYLIAFMNVYGYPENKLIKLITYFVSSNVAILFAWVDFLQGKNMRTWKFSER